MNLNFERVNLRSSPYVGIFGIATDEFVLVPNSVLPKELKKIETELEVKSIKANLGGTSLLGILATGFDNKLVVSSIVEKHEIETLEKEGFEVLQIGGYTATGNLVALNNNGGIASTLFSEKVVGELEDFFGVKFKVMNIAESDVIGACVTVTNKGFIAHPNINENDFKELEKVFGVKGEATTANYGDLFVGNSVLANSKGVIVGELTSGIELSKIDEGLRGEE
ncbi:MAG: translation initiation factor IF-6 [Candidatus Diapherotrites archaeon]|uniref:Translation initiation factor IF-6 n=1 Tax=Candidatus Iainarchaeum sp. TaxID=3101447 RepID=A0A2D6LQC6_9ARCH|nr:translation initiation factor IF-6 [Candidatus Diapherotrites archaeon]